MLDLMQVCGCETHLKSLGWQVYEIVGVRIVAGPEFRGFEGENLLLLKSAAFFICNFVCSFRFRFRYIQYYFRNI